MNLTLYFIIFISKVVENALATLRLIVVANGKKLLGAILALVIAIVWVLITGVVITNIRTDPFKILVFGLGTFVGSYVGSFMEEKVALGTNMIMAITKKENEDMVTKLRNCGYPVTVFEGCGKEDEKLILMILVSRKKRKKLVSSIKTIDNQAMIIVENAFTVHGGMAV